MMSVGQVACKVCSTVASGGVDSGLGTLDRHAATSLPHSDRCERLSLDEAGFVGRKAEVAELLEELEHARIVTVTGPAGAGKSCLVREVVKLEAGRFTGRVLVVGLDGVDDPVAVVEAAVGDVGQHASADAVEAVVAAIGSSEALLVLDGCEHIADRVRRLVDDLVASCSGLRVLATSQHRLHAVGEHAIALSPLEYPSEEITDPRALLSYEAVELFLLRARQADADLVLDDRSVIAAGRICRHVEGVPLALELVAVVAKVMDLESLASLLEEEEVGLPGVIAGDQERHRSLDTVLSWSLSLLSTGELQLLELLSAFPGGADAGALVTVSGFHGVSRTQALDALAALADKSIVTVNSNSNLPGDAARFDLLGIVRRHVRARLKRAGRLDEIARAQLAWCLDATSGTEDALVTGRDQAERLDHLEREHANLCAAITFAIEAGEEGDARAAARLVSSMWRLWELRGRLREGRGWLEKVLAVVSADCELRAHVLDGLGMIAWRQGDHERAGTALAEALDCAAALRDRRQVARVRNHIGLVRLFSGDVSAAREMFMQSHDELERLDCPGEAALASTNLALVAVLEGRFQEAGDLADASLAVHAALGDRHAWATSLLHRSIACYYQGDPQCASEQAREAAGVFLDLGDERSTAFALLALAGALAIAQPAFSLQLAGLAASMAESVGVDVPIGWDDRIEAALAPAVSAAGAGAGDLIASGRDMDPAAALAQIEHPAASSSRGRDDQSGEPSHEAPSRVLISTLGGFEVRRNGRPVRLSPQAARLVKVVVAAEQPLHAEQAIEMLWPEADPEVGRRRLRNLLSKPQLAGRAIVVREADSLLLADGVRVDASVFSAAAADATAWSRSGAPRAFVRRQLRQAAKLYRGDFLPEDPYEHWAARVRERLFRQWLRLIDALAAEAYADGDLDEVEECLRVGIDADPTDESRYVSLARFLAGARRHGAALAVLSRARDAAAELDLPVSTEVVALEKRLRNGASLTPGA